MTSMTKKELFWNMGDYWEAKNVQIRAEKSWKLSNSPEIRQMFAILMEHHVLNPKKCKDWIVGQFMSASCSPTVLLKTLGVPVVHVDGDQQTASLPVGPFGCSSTPGRVDAPIDPQGPLLQDDSCLNLGKIQKNPTKRSKRNYRNWQSLGKPANPKFRCWSAGLIGPICWAHNHFAQIPEQTIHPRRIKISSSRPGKMRPWLFIRTFQHQNQTLTWLPSNHPSIYPTMPSWKKKQQIVWHCIFWCHVVCRLVGDALLPYCYNFKIIQSPETGGLGLCCEKFSPKSIFSLGKRTGPKRISFLKVQSLLR